MKRIVYRGWRFKVEEEDMIVNGSIMHLNRVVPKTDFAVMVPVLPDGRVVLERIYRAVIKKRIYELPAGTMEAGERPEACARRELEEETGFKAKSMRFLFKGYPSPGIITYMAHCYLATGLSRGKVHRDPYEDIKVIAVPLKKALKMIDDGKIVDMKSIAGLLYYSSRFSKQ